MKRKQAKKGPGFVPVLVLLALIAVIGVELVQISGELKRKKIEVADYTQQKQDYMRRIDAMRGDLERADDPDFLQQFAMDHYGYLPAGARQFIDVHGVGD